MYIKKLKIKLVTIYSKFHESYLFVVNFTVFKKKKKIV